MFVCTYSEERVCLFEGSTFGKMWNETRELVPGTCHRNQSLILGKVREIVDIP